ncbi:MAG: glycosyltransferase [Armatimonadota bacterium]
MIRRCPRISVIICTWNRSDGIRAALGGLARQTLPPEEFEALVVDNNSRDDTRQVVASIASTAPYPVHYILETRQGKCWALNAGITAANGEIVACLDDDCVPDDDWLAQIAGAFEREEVGIVGGPCLSVFSEDVRADEYRHFLGRRFFGDFAPYTAFTEIFDKNLPLGMNLAFRKEVADAVGGFDVRLGPRPEAHFGREETAFIRAAQRAGYRVFYSPSMVVRHHIQDGRVTWEAIRRQGYFSGRGVCKERYGRAARGSLIRKVAPTLIFTAELVYSTLRRVLFIFSPRKAAVAGFRAAAAAGKLVELWSGNKLSERPKTRRLR